MPELQFQDYPGPSDEPPLVLLHGLFGSAVNWRGIARRMDQDRRVLVMDMRNHGRSFHDQAMTYPDMARDIIVTLDAAGIDSAHILGHSMGGKAAMVAALREPERVDHLIVVDIAPVIYTHSQLPLIEAMQRLDTARLGSRAAADSALAADIDESMVRQFLLQSLEKSGTGYRWRLNLEALAHAMEDLVGFPDMDANTFDGPALFLHGARSDYVQPEQHQRIYHYFPNAEFHQVADAGHWVHVEQPEALVETVGEFIGSGD